MLYLRLSAKNMGGKATGSSAAVVVALILRVITLLTDSCPMVHDINPALPIIRNIL